MAKCPFGVLQVDFLDRTITPQRVAPQQLNFIFFLEKVKFLECLKALQRYIRLLNYYKTYIPRLAGRLTPFSQILKMTDGKDETSITPELMNEFNNLNNTLDTCCQIALWQPHPHIQLVLITDASIH